MVSGIDESKFAFNKSAEEAAEEVDDPQATSGCNIVLAHELKEIQQFRNKKEYQVYIKVRLHQGYKYTL